MHSIRTKLTALALVMVLLSALLVGLTGIITTRREGERNAAQMMRLLCDNRGNAIDDYLMSVEQTVTLISRYASQELDYYELVNGGVLGLDGYLDDDAWQDREPKRQRTLDEYLETYLAGVESVFYGVAIRTDGATAFYYRINPEMSARKQGFLYSRGESGFFIKQEMTRIEDYAPDDAAHVGWYYTPLQRGHASWIEPYTNENLDVEMVSYETPLYKAGTFIGIIGIDISYSTLVEQIKDIRIFETGYAYLTTKDGTIVYHPTLDAGEDLAAAESRMKGNLSVLGQEDRNETPVAYTYDGIKKQMCFCTLSNGMKLAVVAPEAEINESWLTLQKRMLLMVAALMLLFGVTVPLGLNRVTNPLKRLTKASEQLAAGDYHVELDYDGDDEVGKLTAAFRHLVDHLKIYINDLNSMAYRDEMTGVKNKAAYGISARKLDDLIRLSGKDAAPEFALVMLDCNNLKKINDTYGHDKGDAYLRTACKLICDVFTHSPVFRMGGDEFIVLLSEGSYAEREELLRRFDQRVESVNENAAEPWEFVHIAKGMAAYDPAADAGVESVFRRADEQMYEDKRRSKQGRE